MQIYRLLFMDKKLVYIGVANNVQARFYKHKAMALKSRPLIGFAIIEDVTPGNWKIRERYWIAVFRKNSCFKVLNKNNGGGGPRVLSMKHKKAIRAYNALRGTNGWKVGMSKEARQRLSDRSKGSTHSPEMKEKIRQGMIRAHLEGRAFRGNSQSAAKAKITWRLKRLARQTK